MPTPYGRGRYLTLALLVAVALSAGGCQARDRAGGHADVSPTELRFAVNGDPGKQIIAWADEVGRLSNRTLAVTFVRDAHAGQADYEARTIADVRAGTVDLAWVGARAFDQVGLTTFQPLVAPMLIDSLELEGKVFDAGVPQRLLPSVERLDLVGVGVLPGPIRKVLGVGKPFTAPSDFAGRVVGIQASDVAAKTFTALAATPKAVPANVALTGLDAYDQQLSSIQGNHYNLQAKYVTGNLDLWPRPLVIIANPTFYEKLTNEQRAIMAAASTDAIPIAMEAERAEDAAAITALCKGGLTFAQAGESDIAAMRKAVAPVQTAIRKQPGNAATLDQLTAIKNELHRAPDSADCASTSADQQAATRYDGSYRMSVVWPDVKTADARCVGGPEAGPGGAIYDLDLNHGTLRVWVRVGSPDAVRELGLEAPYRVFKDQLVVTGMTDVGGDTTFDLSDDNGRLTLSNPRGADCGGAAIFTTKPWIRQ